MGALTLVATIGYKFRGDLGGSKKKLSKNQKFSIFEFFLINSKMSSFT